MYKPVVAMFSVVLAALLAGCGGSVGSAGGGPTPMPLPTPSPTQMPSPAATAASVQISAMTKATAEPLPSVAGYSGQVLLPAGSGTATLTYSSAAPNGVPPIVQNSAQPVFGYITITANSPFSLTGTPGFNLYLTPPLGAGSYYLYQLVNGQWSTVQGGFPAKTGDIACFPIGSSPLTLGNGQSAQFAMNGDTVIPTPENAPPCPISP